MLSFNIVIGAHGETRCVLPILRLSSRYGWVRSVSHLTEAGSSFLRGNGGPLGESSIDDVDGILLQIIYRLLVGGVGHGNVENVVLQSQGALKEGG